MSAIARWSWLHRAQSGDSLRIRRASLFGRSITHLRNGLNELLIKQTGEPGCWNILRPPTRIDRPSPSRYGCAWMEYWLVKTGSEIRLGSLEESCITLNAV